MAHYKLALLGFGNVGQSLARLLQAKTEEMSDHYGLTWQITAIASGSHGRAIDPAGIEVERALSIMQEGGSLDRLSAVPAPLENLEFIAACGADVLFENTPVNYESGQPALDHIRAALEKGMHAITANKGPVVHGYTELCQLAQEKRKKFYFESTVMDGAPIFSTFRQLPVSNVRSISGVLNSTTNLILTRMEAGETFDQAVAYAQQIGVAERDPSGDVMGWDASVKLAALVTVIMGVPLKPQQVEREGIDKVVGAFKAGTVETAEKRWKQVCTAVREGDTVKARVAPELVGPKHPFYNLHGTTSVVQFESDVLGKLTIMENDPTPDTTAYGLLADFINAVKGE